MKNGQISKSPLERNCDRTFGQLERLQRMRSGQAVLPKLEVQLSISCEVLWICEPNSVGFSGCVARDWKSRKELSHVRSKERSDQNRLRALEARLARMALD